jgi:hypothetical protein
MDFGAEFVFLEHSGFHVASKSHCITDTLTGPRYGDIGWHILSSAGRQLNYLELFSAKLVGFPTPREFAFHRRHYASHIAFHHCHLVANLLLLKYLLSCKQVFPAAIHPLLTSYYNFCARTLVRFMEQFPPFPSNKRYAMHYRHQSPVEDMITARFPNPKTSHLSPSNISISTFPTPNTIEDALVSSSTPPPPPPHNDRISVPIRQPLPRSQSSSWWMEIRKSPSPKKESRSRKISDAIIQTEGTGNQPVFESDAFAVQMPTTREPILEQPVFRAKLPSPSKAQVDAYQTYKQKAQDARERQHSQGVRVPSKIISYDYTYATAAKKPQHLEPEHAPAGSFPVSPPIPQPEWAGLAYPQGPRVVSGSTHFSTPRKPVNFASCESNNSRPRYARGDADSGAAHSTPSPKPAAIKAKAKFKSQDDHAPKYSQPCTFHNRSPPSSSTENSRTPSPTKPISSRPSPKHAIFGFSSNDHAGTVAGASISSPPKAVKASFKNSSKWAWLRPNGPRVAKPSTSQTATPATIVKTMTYVDPFVLHATPLSTPPNTTPTTSRPASPHKQLIRTEALAQPTAKGEYETGFKQVKSFATLIVKVCLVVYALVGFYFVLDAVREAMHALGAPFRAVKMVGDQMWMVGIWLMGLFVKS